MMYNIFPEIYQAWAEGNKRYFISFGVNALFCLDTDTHQLDLISYIPERQPYHCCLKYGNQIYCFAWLTEHKILVYDMLGKSWNSIQAKIGGINIPFPWLNKDKLYITQGVVNRNLVIVDPQDSGLSTYEIIPHDDLNWAIDWAWPIKENCFLSLSAIKGDICFTDLSCMNTEILQFSVQDDLACACAYDGKNIWISGLRNVIYKLDLKNKKTDIVVDLSVLARHDDNLPRLPELIPKIKSGEIQIASAFDPMFFIGGKIWLIPWRTSYIITLDIQHEKIHRFHIDDEDNAFYCIGDMNTTLKYHPLYVHKKRYLGLYVLKNQTIIEIDTINMTYRRLCYNINWDEIEFKFPYPSLCENKFSYLLFQHIIEKSTNRDNIHYEKGIIGTAIYESIKA